MLQHARTLERRHCSVPNRSAEVFRRARQSHPFRVRQQHLPILSRNDVDSQETAKQYCVGCGGDADGSTRIISDIVQNRALALLRRWLRA